MGRFTRPNDGAPRRLPGAVAGTLAGAGIVAVILAAALGVRALHARATAHHDALVALARLDAQATDARTLGWTQVDSEAPSTGHGRTRAERQAQAIDDLRSAAAAAAPDVANRLTAYVDAVETELAILASPDGEAAATQFAIAEREPAFADFQSSISTAASEHVNALRRADDIAEAGSAMTLTLAALAVGLLAWRFTRIQRSAEEAALRQNETRFRHLINDASDIIAVVDEGLTLTYLSPAVARVLGYAVSHLLGREIVELFDDEERVTLRARLRALAASPNMRIAAEAKLSSRDGSPRYGEIIASNLLHDSGIRGLVLNIRDITERKELEHRLRRQALHDPLTGLPNRDLFILTVEASLSNSARGAHIAVLFMDLDNFKTVNDTLGHNAGDELLVAVARRLQTCVRSHDMVARLSGDEFAVLLHDVRSMEDVEHEAQRMLDVLRSPVATDGASVNTRVSVGIAVDDSSDESAGSLLRRADMAMYAAKRAGGCRYAWSDGRDGTAPAAPTSPLLDELREVS